MHVGALFEFTLPEGASPVYLKDQFERMREAHPIPPPWNLKLVGGGRIGPRLPLMREERDIDLGYHVCHSALPHPGGQRELGILVSRLHSQQLDLHRPLWEVHLIEGLGADRFALYIKMHHSLVDGVSGLRMILRALSADPAERGMPAFWTVGAGKHPRRDAQEGGSATPLGNAIGAARSAADALAGLGRAALDLGRAAIDDRPLQAPYTAPASALGGDLTGQRRFATQQYELERLRALAKTADCTLNDVVLYLSSGRPARDQRRRPERAPGGDQALDCRREATPARAAARSAQAPHHSHQRPLPRRAYRRAWRPCPDPVQRCDLQRPRSLPARLLQWLATQRRLSAFAASPRQCAQHQLRELRGHARLRLHRRPPRRWEAISPVSGALRLSSTSWSG